jgi:hypothetical protein
VLRTVPAVQSPTFEPIDIAECADAKSSSTAFSRSSGAAGIATETNYHGRPRGTDARIGRGEAGARAGVAATIGIISEVGHNMGRMQTPWAE